MLIIEPVIETFDAKGFTAWPVSLPAGSRHLVLCGELAPADVGTVMAVIAVYNHEHLASSGDEDEDPGPTRLIQRITQADSLIAPGGLRVRDTASGLVVSPGCCGELEGWREWNQAPDGLSPWLGHDPAPWIEHLGGKIRVWPDGGIESEAVPPAGSSPVEIAASDLPGLIADAHKKLQDFLDLIEPWARPLAGGAAGGPAAALAAHFHVSWPGPGAS